MQALRGKRPLGEDSEGASPAPPPAAAARDPSSTRSSAASAGSPTLKRARATQSKTQRGANNNAQASAALQPGAVLGSLATSNAFCLPAVLDSVSFNRRFPTVKGLGDGVSGMVNCVRDLVDGAEYAVKTLNNVSEARAELHLWGALTRIAPHPALVSLLHTVVLHDTGKLKAMMPVCGNDAQQLAVQRIGDVRRVLRTIIKTTAAALAHVHSQGLIHGDVKLENILVRLEDGADGAVHCTHVWLADYGFTRLSSDTTVVHLHTPHYIAPEHAALITSMRQPGAGPMLSGAVDMYALGMMFHLLLFGTWPYATPNRPRDCPPDLYHAALRAVDWATPPAAWAAHSDRDAIDLLSGMMATDPAQRLTAAAVLAHPWLADTACVPESVQALLDVNAHGNFAPGGVISAVTRGPAFPVAAVAPFSVSGLASFAPAPASLFAAGPAPVAAIAAMAQPAVAAASASAVAGMLAANPLPLVALGDDGVEEITLGTSNTDGLVL